MHPNHSPILINIGLSDAPNLFWVLWGVWLYIGVAASVLVLDVPNVAALLKLDCSKEFSAR